MYRELDSAESKESESHKVADLEAAIHLLTNQYTCVIYIYIGLGLVFARARPGGYLYHMALPYCFLKLLKLLMANWHDHSVYEKVLRAPKWHEG